MSELNILACPLCETTIGARFTDKEVMCPRCGLILDLRRDTSNTPEEDYREEEDQYSGY